MKLYSKEFKNSATTIEAKNLKYAGLLGSGLPSLSKAIASLKSPNHSHNSLIPKGNLSAMAIPKSSSSYQWLIHPTGNYEGFWFDYKSGIQQSKFGQLSFKDQKGKLVHSFSLSSKQERIFVLGNNITIHYQNPKPKKAIDFSINYYPETIDSSNLYCSEIRYHENPSGTITDGSSVDQNYANSSVL